MRAEYFSVGGKLTTVVGQLTVLKNFLCCRSTAGLKDSRNFVDQVTLAGWFTPPLPWDGDMAANSNPGSRH